MAGVRPLTERQERALLLASSFGVTMAMEGRMSSLEQRGLIKRTYQVHHGRRVRSWDVTEAGRAEVARIRSRRAAAPNPSPG